MATVNVSGLEEQEWELINDDGFVYKRKKRARLDPTSTSAPPPPDPAVEEKNRRERKKNGLTKLKEKYQTELSQWEHLSNALKDMQQKAQVIHHQRQQHATTSSSQLSTSPSRSGSSNPTCRRLLDELLSQAEAQEAIIQDVSNLCDIAEALCDSQEEKLKQSFIELPIWATSPRELLSSLSENLG